MFNRWLQENDFKYLDQHFGINQITSYGVTGYEELRQEVEDRQGRSAEVQALRVQKRPVRAQPDPEKKRLLDSLRVMPRNVFYKAFQPFKKAYNHYRDDHDQFRQLTQVSGVLEVHPDQIVVRLRPRVNYPPQLRRIITAVLDGINAQKPVLPDGSGRRLKLRLAQRSEMTLSIQPRNQPGGLTQNTRSPRK